MGFEPFFVVRPPQFLFDIWQEINNTAVVILIGTTYLQFMCIYLRLRGERVAKKTWAFQSGDGT